MKLKDKILSHPGVETLENEGADGWWAIMRSGWINGRDYEVNCLARCQRAI